jgi:hypothetical protein
MAEFNEEKFQEAIEKLKEGAKETEQSPTCITHEDCLVILQGLENICQQRNIAQQAVAALEGSIEPPNESAHLAACLSKALDTIEKMARRGYGR